MYWNFDFECKYGKYEVWKVIGFFEKWVLDFNIIIIGFLLRGEILKEIFIWVKNSYKVLNVS